ncbi:hypothetical protein EV702DRAFT_1046088 [Suillus placidus]|uniref:Uncharacterized protein n=1 Tax=Suillus placidus TaxID=48579 RepID=A0A9P6ZTI4_9AGAM|nr:hypothetical protein EV702DRAFT_1046088 [Suillus placidus]
MAKVMAFTSVLRALTRDTRNIALVSGHMEILFVCASLLVKHVWAFAIQMQSQSPRGCQSTEAISHTRRRLEKPSLPSLPRNQLFNDNHIVSTHFLPAAQQYQISHCSWSPHSQGMPRNGGKPTHSAGKLIAQELAEKPVITMISLCQLFLERKYGLRSRAYVMSFAVIFEFA